MIDDTEYEESNGMMSRVKNFTFIREEEGELFSGVQLRHNLRKGPVS